MFLLLKSFNPISISAKTHRTSQLIRTPLSTIALDRHGNPLERARPRSAATVARLGASRLLKRALEKRAGERVGRGVEPLDPLD